MSEGNVKSVKHIFNVLEERVMTRNVGIVDRVLRFVVAIALLYLGLGVYGHTPLGVGLDAMGAIAAVTGLLGFCGLYRLLGINTCRAGNNAA
jgi:hypothetical protein